MKPRSNVRPNVRQTRATKTKTSPLPKQSREGATTKAQSAVWESATLLLPENSPLPETLRVQINLFEPAAQTVFVAGTFNDWAPAATALSREEDGYWSVELVLRPGRYEYRLIVDGEWKDDPMAQRYAANPFGGLNSVIEVQHSQPGTAM